MEFERRDDGRVFVAGTRVEILPPSEEPEKPIGTTGPNECKRTYSYVLPVELLIGFDCTHCPALGSTDTGPVCRALRSRPLPKYMDGKCLTYRRADDCPLVKVEERGTLCPELL